MRRAAQIVNHQSNACAELVKALLEASTGFGPVMRVLQTLALPLGHDAMFLNHYKIRIADWQSSFQSGRWDSNPRPSPWQGDVLPLNHARKVGLVADRECRDTESNCGHRDFQSRALPTELSRPDILLLSARDFTRRGGDCQANYARHVQGHGFFKVSYFKPKFYEWSESEAFSTFC